MDRDRAGQFPYAAFFWPALVAASAAETVSSMAAQLLEFATDADDARTAQEPEGATPGKIALELQTLRRGTVSLAPSAAPELNDCSWPIGARPAPTCDLSELTSIWPLSMCSSM